MANFGCPPRFIVVVRQFQNGIHVRFENFPVTNGVTQCYVMAPTLFSMMFSVMLTDAFQDCDAGFPIKYRFDGKLFNLRRLQAKIKMQTDVRDWLLDANGLAENANTESKMQSSMSQLRSYNQHKTNESLHLVQKAHGKPCKEPTITVCFLFLFLFNVPVNNFSVMLRWSHLFLGITSTFGE